MTTVVDQAGRQMDKSIEATKENFSGIRTGRANPSFLNDIMVEYYGTPTPIKSLASIGVPEPRTLAVTPSIHPRQARSRRPSATRIWVSTPAVTATSSGSPCPN